MTAEKKDPKVTEEKAAKAPAKKAAPKKAAAAKATPKKDTAKKTAPKKTVAKAEAKRPAPKKEPAKKAVAEEAVVEAPAKKAAPKAAKKTAKSTKVLKITQVRSQIGYAQKQRRVLTGLGLGRIGRTVTRIDDPCIRGMVAKVTHLVSVEELEG